MMSIMLTVELLSYMIREKYLLRNHEKAKTRNRIIHGISCFLDFACPVKPLIVQAGCFYDHCKYISNKSNDLIYKEQTA
jgi:hypothetical protein